MRSAALCCSAAPQMLVGLADYHIPTNVSLLVVGLVLGGGVAASLAFPEQQRD